MRQCKCGGIVRQYELTKEREAWRCDLCSRYEVFKRGTEQPQEIGHEGSTRWLFDLTRDGEAGCAA